MKKRYFLQGGAAVGGAIALSRFLSQSSKAQPAAQGAAGNKFEINKSEQEWRKALTPQQFNVLRNHGTEAPYSSALDKTFTAGTYHCAGCNLALFSSQAKFDSGTGWPSFYMPLEGAIGTSTDRSLLITRVEVHCRRCGGHLGHVFDDGPPPTGKRYCMNGVALSFVAS